MKNKPAKRAKPTIGSAVNAAFPVLGAIRNLSRAVPASAVQPAKSKPKAARTQPNNMLGAGGLQGRRRDEVRNQRLNSAIGTTSPKKK